MAVLERLAFLQQLPVLLKGTSDDDTPCPGYLYEEMAKMSHESPGSGQCLLEYLLHRLQNNSCCVKLKVLKILLYLCGQGPDLFIQDLRRNVAFIQEAAGASGPPDPLRGMSLYQKVRSTAQELVSSLFAELPLHTPNGAPAKDKTQTGMGPQAFHPHAFQGFGYSQDKSSSGSAGEALLSGIHRAAVAVTQAVGVSAGSQSPCLADQADNAYKPVAIPPGSGHVPTGEAAPGTRSGRGVHRCGVAGGGWEDSDSGHSSRDSLLDKSSCSLSSDAGSKTGSDGQSRSGNREAERAETSHAGDCLQEAQLVLAVTGGHKAFLTQEEVQRFIRGCSRLNCEVVFEMLKVALDDERCGVKLRSMCAIASLMTSDLLTHDHMLGVVRPDLQKLSGGPSGPVRDKATKILLQFEALTRSSPKARAAQPPLLPSSPLDLLNDAVPHPPPGPLLTPSSPVSDSVRPPCCGRSADGSAPEEDSVTPAADDRCHDETFQSRLSLFNGMELVAPVRSTTKTSHTSHQPGAAGKTMDSADPGPQLRTASAFSFLNT